MKLQLLTLFILVFSFQTASAVIVVKEKTPVENNQTVDYDTSTNTKAWKTKKGKKNKLNKKKKFKFFQLLKLKRALKKQKDGEKRFDPVALSAGISVLLGVTIMITLGLGIGFVLLLGGSAGIIGLKRIKKDPENLKGKGMAWLGIIGGIIGVLLGAFLLFVVFTCC